MDVYLVKKGTTVVPHTDIAAMKEIEGIITPHKTVTMQQWDEAGEVAYIDDSGNIQIGIKPDVKARQEEIASLQDEEKMLQRELDNKDYKIIKCAEQGLVLAEQDPELHSRRNECRARINEIRDRLVKLNA
jgi:hypothetical protein